MLCEAGTYSTAPAATSASACSQCPAGFTGRNCLIRAVSELVSGGARIVQVLMVIRGAKISDSVVFEGLLEVVGEFLFIHPLAISSRPPARRSEGVPVLERYETRRDIRGRTGEFLPGSSSAKFVSGVQGHGALDAHGAADDRNVGGVQQTAKDQREVQVISYEEDSARLFIALTSAESVSRLNSLLSYYGLPNLEIVAVRITCGQGYADVASSGDNTSASGGPTATGSCVPCGRESYKEAADDSDCVACPEGVRTSVEGSISAAACKVSIDQEAGKQLARPIATTVAAAVAVNVAAAVAVSIATSVGSAVTGTVTSSVVRDILSISSSAAHARY